LQENCNSISINKFHASGSSSISNSSSSFAQTDRSTNAAFSSKKSSIYKSNHDCISPFSPDQPQQQLKFDNNNVSDKQQNGFEIKQFNISDSEIKFNNNNNS
jgi:hypothetical protein